MTGTHGGLPRAVDATGGGPPRLVWAAAVRLQM